MAKSNIEVAYTRILVPKEWDRPQLFAVPAMVAYGIEAVFKIKSRFHTPFPQLSWVSLDAMVKCWVSEITGYEVTIKATTLDKVNSSLVTVYLALLNGEEMESLPLQKTPE